jgi:GT2 family glycosyltransferase
MKYSIIIATYNRLDELKELLASVEKISFDRNEFDIIFVDDGSTDGTDKYIQNYQSESNIQINYFFQQNKGPAEARNYGMREAQGAYFIFVDSDCLFPPDYLLKIDEFVKQNNPDAFGGPDTYHLNFPPLLKAINYAMTSFIGTGGTRGGKINIQKKYYPRTFNMGISRDVFHRIGGMPKLTYGQGEDMEFSGRIHSHGFTVMYIKDAFVYHKRRTSFKKFFRQIFNWAQARINLGKMNKELLKPIHFVPAALLFVLCIILILSFFPFFPSVQVFFFIFSMMLLIAVFAFVQSFAEYKSVTVALLSIATLYVQVFAYGIGMWSGILKYMKEKLHVSK